MPPETTEAPRLRLTADLARVCDATRTAPVPLSDILCSADDRGFALVLLLATFPFVLPFPTLGLATPVGFALALAAFGLVLGRPASLPASLGALEVGPVVAARAAAVLHRVSGLLLRLTRPRMAFMMVRRMRILLGLSLVTAAVVLGLPIPLPLSNFFPAVAILLLAGGMLEGDGLLVLAGHGATLAVCAVVAASGTTLVAVGTRLVSVFGR